MIRGMAQLIGFLAALCGIICCMCETETPLRTMLIGFALLIIGAAICYIGRNKEYGTY